MRRPAWGGPSLTRSAAALLGLVLGLLLTGTGCASFRAGMALDAARRAHAREDCRGVEQALRSLEAEGALSGEREAEAVFYRGVCLERYDRIADAAEHYRYVLERHPASRVAPRAVERSERIPSWMAVRVEPEPSNARTVRNRSTFDLGRPNPVRRYFTDFGPPVALELCVLREPGVSSEQVERAVRAMRRALAGYAIALEVPWVRDWEPPTDEPGSRIDGLRALPLSQECDRLLALSALGFAEQIERTFGAMAPGAGVAGEVESDTFTRGYVFVRPMSLLHAPGFDASELVVHELHHFLRCDHDLIMDDCYRQIVRLKRAAAQNRAAGNDFFPAITVGGELLLERDSVDARLTASGEAAPEGARAAGD